MSNRLAGLPALARAAVEQAAVLGEHFDWRLLVAPEDELPEALRHAVDSGLLEVDPGSRGFRFRHALNRAAVLGTLLPPERGNIARTLLATVDAQPEEADADRLGLAARLAEDAGDDGRAFDLLLAASRAALRVGAVAWRVVPPSAPWIGRRHRNATSTRAVPCSMPGSPPETSRRSPRSARCSWRS